MTSTQQRVVKTNATTSKGKRIKFGEISPVDLRDWDGDQLYIRNNRDNPISFDDNKGNLLFLSGRNKGNHISVLEIAIARNPGIQKEWRKGNVTVSTDPAMEDELFEADTKADQVREEDFAAKTKHSLVSNDSNVIYSGKAETFDYPDA